MKVQHFGPIQIHKITELPMVESAARDLLANVTPEIVEEGRGWLSDRFIHPSDDILYLSFHSYVVRTPRHTILVDTCCGNDKSRESMPAWHMLNTPFLDELAAVGLRPEDIDIVLCTHLHADHVGWNTRLLNGEWVPTFPNATYIMGREEFDHWQALHESGPEKPVNRGAHEDSVLPVVKAGQAMMVETDFVVEMDLGEGIWLEATPGHSPGHVAVHVKAGDRHGIMTGDAIHHPLQLRYPELGLAVDYDSGQALASRQRILDTYADTPTVLLSAHFTAPTACHIIREGEGFNFRFVDD